MLIHLLWIINKSGQLIYNQHFTPKEVFGDGGRSSDRQMTLASVLYGLHGLSKQIAPVPADVLECDGVVLIEGNDFNVLVYESPTGVKFVLFADTRTYAAPQLFADIYLAYADYVLKNPLYLLDSGGIGQPIRIPHFKKLLETIVGTVNATATR